MKIKIIIIVGLLQIAACSSKDYKKQSLTISALVKEFDMDMKYSDTKEIFFEKYGINVISDGIIEGKNMIRTEFSEGKINNHNFNRLYAQFLNDKLYFMNLQIWNDSTQLDDVYKYLIELTIKEFNEPGEKNISDMNWKIRNEKSEIINLLLSIDPESQKIIYISLGYYNEK